MEKNMCPWLPPLQASSLPGRQSRVNTSIKSSLLRGSSSQASRIRSAGLETQPCRKALEPSLDSKPGTSGHMCQN